MADFLKIYGIQFDNPVPPFAFPDEPLDQLILQLTPAATPIERLLNDLVIYNKELSFLLYQQEQTQQLLRQLRAAPDYESRKQLLCEKYGEHLEQVTAQFQAKYEAELKKKGSLNPFSRVNRDYLLLLAQHLHDLQAAKDGQGYHALTVELKILANYAYYGPDYFKPFPLPPKDPGTTNRAVAAPDGNMVMYVSGFMSDWQAAAREAYITGYKLGYRLSDIYFFSYVPNSANPVQLSEVMDRSGVFIGDARLLTDKQGALGSAKGAEAARLKQEIEDLLNKNNGRLRQWAFTSEQNLNSRLYDKAVALAAQLHTILDSLPSEQKGRRINLMGNSQGSAILGGFLLQKNPSRTAFLLDAQLNPFVDKYVLNIGAHGGAFLAETGKISGETGFLFKLAKGLLALLAKWLPQLAPLKFAQEALSGPATQDLAVSSSYVAENYRALSPENRAETTQNLASHQGMEIYNANDDVTTSVPLNPLPSTVQIRMMPGRHGIPTEGTADGSYAVMNKYIYPFFKGEEMLPCLESDQLAYCGYIKKGLADMEVSLDQIALPGFLKPLQKLLASEKVKSKILPFIGGQAGVVDYVVAEQVYTKLSERLTRQKPLFWPSPRFDHFKP